jgi:hypothetical protein
MILTLKASVIRLGKMIGASCLCLVGYMALINFGPQVEANVLPVIQNEQLVINSITQPHDNQYQVKFHLVGTKTRPCNLKNIEWYLIYDEKMKNPAYFHLHSDSSQVSLNRPVGDFIGGDQVATIQSDLLAMNSKLVGFYAYDCDMPWTTLDKIGPFDDLTKALIAFRNK